MIKVQGSAVGVVAASLTALDDLVVVKPVSASAHLPFSSFVDRGSQSRVVMRCSPSDFPPKGAVLSLHETIAPEHSAIWSYIPLLHQ